jgi:hypothetical protein
MKFNTNWTPLPAHLLKKSITDAHLLIRKQPHKWAFDESISIGSSMVGVVHRLDYIVSWDGSLEPVMWRFLLGVTYEGCVDLVSSDVKDVSSLKIKNIVKQMVTRNPDSVIFEVEVTRGGLFRIVAASGKRFSKEISESWVKSTGKAESEDTLKAKYLRDLKSEWQLERKKIDVEIIEFLKPQIDEHLPSLIIELRDSIKKNSFGVLTSDKSKLVTIEFLKSVKLPYKFGPFCEQIHKYIVDTIDHRNIVTKQQTMPTTGLEFEELVRDRMVEMGWKASVTKASGDQGIDVVATKNGLRLGLQCKLYTGNVSNSAIQEAFGGKQHYGLDQVAVITTGVFTKSALALAESTGVLLVAYADIDKIDQRLNVK